ncbi:MAG TPA: aminopeptidase [Sphaerochaeta sp.]|nr:aminopeptidase [Sphaerochaeta sp.]
MSEQVFGVDQALIDRYADLIIEKGINLKAKKNVMILTGSGTYYFARALAKSAYRHQATYVQILVDDLDVLATRLEHQETEQLEFSPDFIKAMDYEFIAHQWSYIRVDNTEDRLDHPPLDGEKNQILSAAKRRFSEARSSYLMRHELPWCVCVAPGPRWAEQVLGEGASTSDLMEVLKPILLLDQADPAAAWDAKGEMLNGRQEHLNSLNLEYLHFSSPRTDLKVYLNPTSRFVGGAEDLPDGRPFFANLPTEEIFTTPDWRRTEGYVTTTRPVSVLNTPTEEVRLTFKEGKVVDYSAKEGKEVLDRFFAIDEGTRSIGELALVDETSPIAQSGLIFHSILIDENASCHIALGEGYPIALKGGNLISGEENLRAAGCNTSLMHTDFMIGSSDMQITGYSFTGEKVELMRDGVFLF